LLQFFTAAAAPGDVLKQFYGRSVVAGRNLRFCQLQRDSGIARVGLCGNAQMMNAFLHVLRFECEHSEIEVRMMIAGIDGQRGAISAFGGRQFVFVFVAVADAHPAGRKISADTHMVGLAFEQPGQVDDCVAPTLEFERGIGAKRMRLCVRRIRSDRARGAIECCLEIAARESVLRVAKLLCRIAHAALPTLLPLSRTSCVLSQRPVSINFGKSMPVAMPIPCSM